MSTQTGYSLDIFTNGWFGNVDMYGISTGGYFINTLPTVSIITSAIDLTLQVNTPSVCVSFADYDSFSDLPNNDYFVATDNYTNERNLYDLLLTESFNQFGVPLVYYQSSYDVNYDKIYGEDNNRKYLRYFDIMGFYELPKEMEQWSMFGIEGLDTFQIFVSKRHFKTASGSYIPRPGDVLQAKYNDRFYEITDVGEEEYVYMQRKHTWTFTVKVFRDEHIGVDSSISATATITPYTDKNSDIFDITSIIDQEKPEVLYSTSGETTAPNTVWGVW